MNENTDQEIALRRKVFKLFDNGKPMREIRRLIPRSRSWLYKWKHRFLQRGFAAVESPSKAPLDGPHRYQPKTRILVLNLRKRLRRSTAGLCGARAIRRELKNHHRLKRIPALATINRWLKAGALTDGAVPRAIAPFYPHPPLQPGWVFQACDWTLRYLEGGQKVFAFHTLDLQTHALAQTLAADKSTPSLIRHALEAWQQIGWPDFLQLDNDAAFTGLGRKGRLFGRFVRLALYLGIELIFIPPGEPRRNSKVERVNGLWSQSFWNKNHFTSLSQLRRKREKFFAWYETYEPPSLGGLSVKQAGQGRGPRRLPKKEVEAVPEKLPLTNGRLHFIRRVSEQGEVEILKEKWKVSKRLRDRYVWATINTGRQSLEIYYRASERAQTRLLKQYVYDIDERVRPLTSRYRRRERRIKMMKLI